MHFCQIEASTASICCIVATASHFNSQVQRKNLFFAFIGGRTLVPTSIFIISKTADEAALARVEVAGELLVAFLHASTTLGTAIIAILTTAAGRTTIVRGATTTTNLRVVTLYIKGCAHSQAVYKFF